MLDDENRRQLLCAVLQGLCANPNVFNGGAEAIAKRALDIVFAIERFAPGSN